MRFKIINALYFIFIGIIALFILGIVEVPAVIRESRLVTSIAGPRIPKEEDLKELEQALVGLLQYLEKNEAVKEEIAATYLEVEEAPVCSIAKRHFNTLAKQYEEYCKQLSEIQKHIEKIEKKYDRYLKLLDNIPEFSSALRQEKEEEFQKVILPLYEEVSDVKQRYLSDKEEVDQIYQKAKKRADDLFEEYFDLMCHTVNREAGGLACPSIERYYVANVIENRIKSPLFKENTIYDVLNAPDQYAPVTYETVNRNIFSWVKKEMEDYLRGRIDTGMPDNVVYQALFKQGSGVWKEMKSGHYFCYA